MSLAGVGSIRPRLQRCAQRLEPDRRSRGAGPLSSLGRGKEAANLRGSIRDCHGAGPGLADRDQREADRIASAPPHPGRVLGAGDATYESFGPHPRGAMGDRLGSRKQCRSITTAGGVRFSRLLKNSDERGCRTAGAELFPVASVIGYRLADDRGPDTEPCSLPGHPRSVFQQPVRWRLQHQRPEPESLVEIGARAPREQWASGAAGQGCGADRPLGVCQSQSLHRTLPSESLNQT